MSMTRLSLVIVLAAVLCLVAAPPGVADGFQTPPLRFVSVQPCRLLDTRVPSPGLPLEANVPRVLPIPQLAQQNQCTLPAEALAVAVNVTALNPVAKGNLRLYPAGQPLPPTSTVNYPIGQAVANSAITALGENGGITVISSAGQAHLILDLSGYLLPDEAAVPSPWTNGTGVTYTDVRVGLGSTQPHSRLSVGGDGESDYSVWVQAPQDGILARTDSPGRSALVGIASQGWAGKFQGNVLITGTLTESSDARWKRRVTPLDDALDTVMRLRGIEFEWDREQYPEKQFPSGRQIGFLAQDVEAVAPGLVVTDAEGFKSVAYARLTPLLVEAVKQQQEIIDRLQARLDRLEKALGLDETEE